MALRALASVNLAAIQRNVARLRQRAAPAAICAVVKADGYGHGAIPAGRAALAGGAGWLAVATAHEAAELRAGGITEPILVMGAVSAEELPQALASGADLVAWTTEFVDAAMAAAGGRALRFHVKFDTGMGRLGTREAEQALEVARRIASAGEGAVIAGAMTHFATADDDASFMSQQLERFAQFVPRIRELAPGLVAHAANSAATVRDAATHLDMVRCGIAIYGCDPMNHDPDRWELEPAMEWTSYLAAVKPAQAGDSTGYGRRFIASGPTYIGTAPIGYADGVRRGLTNNCDVLFNGRRYPLVGTVSMDNITIDLGPEPAADVGATVTLIGRNGAERQTAEQLAARLQTINYEVVCAISARVPRHYHRDGQPL